MMSWQILAVAAFLTSAALPIVACVLLRCVVERRWPAEEPKRLWSGTNYLAYVVWLMAVNVFAPLTTFYAVFLTNRLGGGLIALPTHGWGLALGFVVFFLVFDLGEYLFHRAEHAIPALWAMHSLHHSDAEFDASTAGLHYWMAPLIHYVTISVPLGLLFKVPPIDLALWVLISNHVLIMHANVPWDFGRFAWLISSPRYHRLHHSALPEHFDSNFASILPVWDVLFQTQHRDWRSQQPPVGLGEGQEAKTLFDLVFWPVRSQLRRLA